MPVRIRESDYHELNAHYELMRKEVLAFYGFDFVVLVSAVTMAIATSGWPGLVPVAGLWIFLLGLFVFIGFITVVLVPFMDWMWGGTHLASPQRIEVRESARMLKLLLLLLHLAASVPVICAFLLFFFTGSKVLAVLIGLCGTAAKISVFPKRQDLEKIVLAGREEADVDFTTVEEAEQSGRYLAYIAARDPSDGEVEIPAHVRRRLRESRDDLESLMESGRLKRMQGESGEHLPRPAADNPE
ncbi:MAG: hypothetical protein ACYS8W_01755 [Planctomycetota bacterium]|jgi:hypothetical protein